MDIDSKTGVGGKREREWIPSKSDSEYEPSIKIPRLDIMVNTQGCMQIAIMNQLEDIARNVVWMNDADYDSYFQMARTRSGAAAGAHLQIAGRVYEVAKKPWLPANTLGVSPLQYSECKEWNVFFLSDKEKMVQVASYSGRPHEGILNSVTFDIGTLDISENRKTCDIYELEELRSFCFRHFKNKFLVLGQKFIVEHPKGYLELTVNDMKDNAEANEGRTRNFFKRISEKTEIDFNSDDWNGYIVAKEEGGMDKFTFSVALAEPQRIREQGKMPLLVDMEKLTAQFKKDLQGAYVMPGCIFNIKYENEPLICTSTKIGEYTHLTVNSQRYQTSFRFYDNALKLTVTKGIEFTFGKVLHADRIEVSIISASRNDAARKAGGYKFLSAKALEDAMKIFNKTFLRGDRYTIALPTTQVKIELKLPESTSTPDVEGRRWKRVWKVDENTEFNFSRADSCKWPIVDEKAEIDLAKVIIKVESRARQSIAIKEESALVAVKRAVANGVTKGQIFKKTVEGNDLTFTVVDFHYANQGFSKFKYEVLGKINDNTQIDLQNGSLGLALKDKSMPKDPIVCLKEMGVGGLYEVGKRCVRKIVYERRSPMKEELRARGIQPTKGILFYGPPGTGKTLLARSLGEILNCSKEHIQMMSATSVYNKYVGESEANVRALFKPAIEASKKFKTDSELFVLVIDEIDGILSARQGDSNSNWRKGVVTEFLAQMDGLEQLNNILVIGMTNRLEDLDEGVVRSGRFGYKIAFELPDADSRKEILQIHCKKMIEQSKFAGVIDFDELAEKTKGMSGADICELVKLAGGYGVERLMDLDMLGKDLAVDFKEGLVSMKDFRRAIEEHKTLQGNVAARELPASMYM